MFHVEWYIRQICSSSIMPCNFTIIGYNYHTDIYTQTYTCILILMQADTVYQDRQQTSAMGYATEATGVRQVPLPRPRTTVLLEDMAI